MVDNPPSHTSAVRHGSSHDRAKRSALPHSTTQFIEITDTQIFPFLVMPFLSILTCSMVFFSHETETGSACRFAGAHHKPEHLDTRATKKRMSSQTS